MSIIVKAPESQFVPAPPGAHAAVCCDVVELGDLPNRFDPEAPAVRTVRLVFQIAEDMPDGKPFLIRKDYRASLHERAGLRKDLASWRGRDFTFEELVGFDLESVIRVPCMLNVVQRTGSKGGTFSNIAAIMPLPKGMTKITPRDYVRVKDRQPPAALAQHNEPEPYHADLDEVPF